MNQKKKQKEEKKKKKKLMMVGVNILASIRAKVTERASTPTPL